MSNNTFTTYTPPFWAINGHVSTIANAIFRKQPSIEYKTEIFIFNDSDVTRLNWLQNNNEELIIIIPGMGSEATRNYITNTAYHLNNNGYDVLVPDHRDTSTPNTAVKSYHSSNYQDLEEIINSIPENQYSKIHLVGYCLGGSIVLNYLHKAKTKNRVQKSITISAPLELKNACLALEQPNNYVYQRRFVKNLKEKLSKKAIRFPEIISKTEIMLSKTIQDIDNAYTTKVYGFHSTDEYYKYGSAANFINEITSPLLIICSTDDTFIPLSASTIEKIHQNKYITPLITKKGGHVAFPNFSLKGIFWHEEQILNFVSS